MMPFRRLQILCTKYLPSSDILFDITNISKYPERKSVQMFVRMSIVEHLVFDPIQLQTCL